MPGDRRLEARAALAIVVGAQRPDGTVPSDAVQRAATAAGVTVRQVRRWLADHAKHLDRTSVAAPDNALSSDIVSWQDSSKCQSETRR